MTPGHPIFGKFALRYARAGFEVFPLAVGSKDPMRGSHGHLDATSDVKRVEELAKEFPFNNIGLRTGPGSNIDAVDIDPLKGGFDTERHLRASGKTWPQTPVQRTRSGGRHVILQHHPLIINGTNRLGPGIDFRAAGGYIVATPSIVWPGAYSWLAWPPCGPAPAPQWLLDHITAEQAQRQADKRGEATPLPDALEPALERARKALSFIPSDDRETWLTVGMALSGSFGEGGRDLWDAWSRQSIKFNADGQVKAWRSFKGSSRTVGTIFWLRRQHRGRAPLYSL